MNFELQLTLENDLIKIVPLREDDFESLYLVASDPLIWEQHPNKNRYQREVFKTFFKGALESQGAFLIIEKVNGSIIGSTRFYDLDMANSSVAVGYTFIARQYWGQGYNVALKSLMFDYAFQFVDCIILHIGETNFRSQKAVEKIGAKKINTVEVAYFGEAVKINFEYIVDKSTWQNRYNE